jgi:hypothetical protein
MLHMDHVRFGSKADICSVKRDVRFTPKADMCSALAHVRFVPIADIVGALIGGIRQVAGIGVITRLIYGVSPLRDRIVQ